MKQKYTVKIAGFEIRLVTEESQERVEAVVSMIDRRMREITLKSPNCPTVQSLALCCMDYCSEKLLLCEKVEELEKRLGEGADNEKVASLEEKCEKLQKRADVADALEADCASLREEIKRLNEQCASLREMAEQLEPYRLKCAELEQDFETESQRYLTEIELLKEKLEKRESDASESADETHAKAGKRGDRIDGQTEIKYDDRTPSVRRRSENSPRRRERAKFDPFDDTDGE